MKFLNLLAKMHAKKIRKATIREIISELERQKKHLSAIKKDDIDEAYENGMNMSIFITRELLNKE